MTTWEVSKQNGIFGLYVRSTELPGEVHYSLLKKITYQYGRMLIHDNLATGNLEDINRWEKEE